MVCILFNSKLNFRFLDSDIIFNKAYLQYVHEVIIKQSTFFLILIAIAVKEDEFPIYCIKC